MAISSRLDYQTVTSKPELVRVLQCEPWRTEVVVPVRLWELAGVEQFASNLVRLVGQLPSPDVVARVCVVAQLPESAGVAVRDKDILVASSNLDPPHRPDLLGCWSEIFWQYAPADRFLYSLSVLLDEHLLAAPAATALTPMEQWKSDCQTAYLSVLESLYVELPLSFMVAVRVLYDCMAQTDASIRLGEQRATLQRLQRYSLIFDANLTARLSSVISAVRGSQYRIAAVKLVLFFSDTATLELPDIQELNLAFEPWSNIHLQRLSCLRHLECLNLTGTFIDADGLQHLHWLPNLATLILRKTRIHDYGLQFLSKCNLVELDLSETLITDAACQYLCTMKGLKKLNLVETNLTPPGIGKLRQELPQCQIESDCQVNNHE